MALRAVASRVLASRPTVGAVLAPRFLSTTEIFSEPSFPVRSNGFEGTDPAVWLQKYEKADPADMWKVGSFPVQEAMTALQPPAPLAADELWDTSGMLSALSENLPLRDGPAHGVDEMLREMDRTYGYYADSVLKKRRKKMNKHKHRKRRKALRMRTKKN
ncbi:hypothetical protein ATCC90586_009167 [Pythium insidiosum]|nr:hypothetical protein ATCC90586_009167 [Pythium insidiosum]